MLESHLTFLTRLGIITVLCLSITACSKKEPVVSERPAVLKTPSTEADYLYSPFLPPQERQWMTLENAIAAEKFSGMIEVSQFVNKPQTEAQKNAATALYEKTLKSTQNKGLFDFSKSLADGYIDDPATDSVHYTNYNYIFDGDFLNPEEPEYLMFYKTTKGYLLAGVMFIQDDLNVHGEQIGGPETVWHFHSHGAGMCLPMNIPEESLKKNHVSRAHCPKGQILLTSSPEMLHVWFIEHPQGRFASSMAIDESLLIDNAFIISETEKAIQKNASTTVK